MEITTFHPNIARWVALRTRARWEKKIATELITSGVPVYVPLVRSLKRYAGTSRTSHVPLFGGYVFCSEIDFIGNPRVSAGCRKQVAQVLRPPDPALLQKELAEIAALLSDHELVQEQLYGKPGDVVRLIGGPLAGLEGTIVGLDADKRQLLLEITFLGVKVEVKIGEQFVAKP